MKRLGGWWRLWIFLSLLWGIGVVAYSVSAWPSHGEKRQLWGDDWTRLSEQTKALAMEGEKAWQTHLDGLKKVKLDSEGFPVKPSIFDKPSASDLFGMVVVESIHFPSDQTLMLPKGTPKAQVEAVKQDYARVQVSILAKSRWSFFFFRFWVWIGPCLSLLVLASSLRWVVRGFKKEPAT